MIDRFGDRTHRFTVSGAQIIFRAREHRAEMASPELSPRHLGLALLDRYADAFGNSETQNEVRNSLVSWETITRYDPEETMQLLQAASAHAEAKTGFTVVRDIDILYATLLPDSDTPAADPFPFIKGDQRYPFLYAQRVFAAAGGKFGGQHYGTVSHAISELEQRREETHRTSGWREFSWRIPEQLFRDAQLIKAS